LKQCRSTIPFAQFLSKFALNFRVSK
jgi:hypothetical protein